MVSPLIITFEIFLSIYLYRCRFTSSLLYRSDYFSSQVISTVTVDKLGNGNYTTVQEAVNFIPVNNYHWIRIHVRGGVYNEKVIIPKEKPFIVLEGDGRGVTVIQAAEGGEVFKSSTFSLFASNFVARNITFKNSHDNSRNFIWAPAALITGDKAAFFDCDFISVQDTLTDSRGRHYFESCYIQGAVDFIWGDGQSIYQGCTINVTYEATKGSDVGYITAQARHSPESESGFVFVGCSVVGTTGSTYLGRAYTNYSRVLFYKSYFEGLIASEGWLPWYSAGREKDIVFAEEGCSGPGADKSKRVRWEKRLSPKEVESLVNVDTFINGDGWLHKLPNHLA